MIILIRHSHDRVKGSVRHAHDTDITEKGVAMAQKKARKLVRRYGRPSMILCSPFRRTRETMTVMADEISISGKRQYIDPRLGRIFADDERKQPKMAASTQAYGVNADEGRRRFRARVDNFVRDIDQYIDTEEVVWVITHAIVFNSVLERYGHETGHLGFLDSKRLRRRS